MAGLLATGAGVVAKWTLGSTVPVRDGLVTVLLGDSAPWLVQPALAASTAFIFGITYLTVTARLGVGTPLRQLMRRAPKNS